MRRYSSCYYEFSFILYSLSPKCYRYLRNVLPLPCKTSLFIHFERSISENLECLTDIEKCESILRLFESSSDQDEIPICLGLDATEIFDNNSKSRSGDMVYHAQPLNLLSPDFVLHYSLRKK